MPKTLSEESKTNILNALTKIAELTNSGELPNDAIVKIASEMQIPHGHIQLLVNAYNTGRTTAQRKSSDDVWEKAADFPLADAGEILEQMYPTEIKTAAEIEADNVVSIDYQFPPTWVSKKEEKEKRARATALKFVDTPAVPYEHEDTRYDKAQAQIQQTKQAVAQARYRAAHAFDLAIRAKNELVDYFKQSVHVPFMEVKANASRLYGQIADNLMGQIVAENPKFAKQHSNRKLASTNDDVYAILGNCMELTDAYITLKEDFEVKQAAAEEEVKALMSPFQRAKKAEEGIFSGFGEAYRHGAGEDPVIFSPNSLTSKAIGAIGGLHGQSKEPAKKMDLKPTDSLLRHETAIDALNQEAVLNDILSSDDIIRHHNPHDVINAYNTIKAIAPRAASNQELLTTLLRDRLERGQQSLFDLKTLSEVEYNLKRIEGTGQPGSGYGDNY